MPGDARLDRLKRRLSVAYEFAPPDAQALEDSIYRQRTGVWREAMTEFAGQAGGRRSGRGPNGNDRAYLRQAARDDAASILQTFSRDLESQIEKLYRANPDGDRQYYISALQDWAEKRSAWKDRQITLMNQKATRHYAQQRFRDENGARGARYRFEGPAPVCDDCAAMLAAGEVGQDFVDSNPTPLHPNCPHSWKFVSLKVSNPQNIWVG